MTTLVGMKSNMGIEGIVFATDMQLTSHDEKCIPTQKSRARKIIFGKEWMLADAGTVFKEYLDFERILKGKNKDYSKDATTGLIKRAVKRFSQGKVYKGIHFPEVNTLNMMQRRKDGEYKDLHEFLLAVNSPKLGLWKVDEFGNLKRAPQGRGLEYYVLGSGGKYAAEYIKRQVSHQRVHLSKITLTRAIDLAFAAVKYAQKDIYSSGFDVIVMTHEGVVSYGESIQRSTEKALRDELKKMKDEYCK